ncbi:uncharacterized protein LOC101858430 [Aplysia californica]|uniref:Uncharacterized protein LOC101858430 n=1 Tax=Aplysia californica TaxID=6500 RepID=A0ABM1A667_APLCA|nr:uncharacterized protein LOC101858430 [Aplysia californica]
MMDPDGEGWDSDAFDAIDSVARANDVADDIAGSAFLPEVRSSPCPIYSRNQQQLGVSLHQQLQHQRSDARNDLLYSTNCHGGQTTHRTHSRGSPRSASSHVNMESAVQMERDLTFQRDVQAGKAQKYARPILPKEMTSHDFVKSWLQHGSEPKPQVASHFPDIITKKEANAVTAEKKPPRKNAAKKPTVQSTSPQQHVSKRRRSKDPQVSE